VPPGRGRLLQLLFTYLPAMNTLFQTAPMSATEWVAVVALGLVASGVVGAEKWWRYGRKHRHPT
jgi:cation-transporting ATPase F